MTEACKDCGYLDGHSRTCPSIVDRLRTRVVALEARVAELEKLAHPAIAQTRIEERLTKLENRKPQAPLRLKRFK